MTKYLDYSRLFRQLGSFQIVRNTVLDIQICPTCPTRGTRCHQFICCSKMKFMRLQIKLFDFNRLGSRVKDFLKSLNAPALMQMCSTSSVILQILCKPLWD